MRATLAVVLASVVVLAAAGATAAPGAKPDFEGTIAYEVSSNRTAWLEALDLATGKVTRLTAVVPAVANADGPAWGLVWSPTGGKLAFTTPAVQGAGNSVKVVDVATRRVTNLTASLPPALYGRLTWSPDGTSIAFSGLDDTPGSTTSGVYLARPDIPGARRLHHVAGELITWSPDGERVAYVDPSGHRGRPCSKDVRMFVVSIAGAGGSTELRTHPAYPRSTYSVSAITWRPGGGRLLYVTNHTADRGLGCYPDRGAAAVVIDMSRTTSTRLLTRRAWIGNASWSPTGRHIAYSYDTKWGQAFHTLRVMTPDGRGRRILVSRFDGVFAWTHNGGRLIEAYARKVLLRDATSGRARQLAGWGAVFEPAAGILAVGRDAVAVNAGERPDANGTPVAQGIVLARLNGGSRLVTLRPASPEQRIGDIAVTLP